MNVAALLRTLSGFALCVWCFAVAAWRVVIVGK